MLKRVALLVAAAFVTVWIAAWLFVANPTLPSGARVAAGATPARLAAHVASLAALEPSRAHPRGMQAAAAYVRKNWEDLGLTVTGQPLKIVDFEVENLSVSFGPATGERVVVGAHYDCYGRNPGADDNASGTAGLLELARLLKATPPPHGIDLVAYPTEEPPYFATEEMGSAVHAKSLRERGTDVAYMISLEMIGDFSDEPGTQDFPLPLLKLFYGRRGNFVAIVGRPREWTLVRKLKARMSGATELAVRSMNAPSIVEGIDWSDHRSYWENGYRAVMVTDTSFFRNHRYHTKEDTPDKLDYRRMAQVVDAVFAAVSEP